MRQKLVFLVTWFFVLSCGEVKTAEDVKVGFAGIDTNRPYEQGESLPFNLRIDNASGIDVCVSAQDIGIAFTRVVDGEALPAFDHGQETLQGAPFSGGPWCLEPGIVELDLCLELAVANGFACPITVNESELFSNHTLELHFKGTFSIEPVDDGYATDVRVVLSDNFQVIYR